MRVLYRSMVLSTLVVASALAAACGHKDSNRDAFKNTDDLLLPNAANNAVASPQELGLKDSVPAAPAVAKTTAPAPERVATTRHTSHRYSSRGRRGSYGSYGGGYVPVRQPVVVRHTKRDAIVGAAAGAAIGATVDRSHVRGAVIGGVLGGVLGGVVGHNVDVQKY